jgi:8-oxo-dGTP pyrophosphatase MutT (NUDIX family)
MDFKCINCGKAGHVFRDCKEPVMSYGIIAIKHVDSVPYYLMIRRRDSLSYVEFMRGKYSLSEPVYIQKLINGMTCDEQTRLISQTFDSLWSALWNNQNTRQYRNEYNSAKRIFDLFRNTGDLHGKLLIRYIDESSKEWADPEWGFPKGRRMPHESTEACALREFKEETGCDPAMVLLIPDKTYIEEYIGTNGIKYRQTYFIGRSNSDAKAEFQPHNRVMNREVGAIAWLPFEEAYLKIRHSNKEKRALLAILHHQIMKEGILDWESVGSTGKSATPTNIILPDPSS